MEYADEVRMAKFAAKIEERFQKLQERIQTLETMIGGSDDARDL